jgi:hypothetical protein
MSSGAFVYLDFLRVTKSLRASRRNFLKRLPRWVSDAYDILEYINFLKLLPILIAIAFVPKHFFRKLPRITNGNSDLFLDPFKATTTFASLAVIVSTRIGFSVEYGWMLLALVLASVTAPVWTLILVLLVYGLLKPAKWFRRWIWRVWNDRWFNLYVSSTALKRLKLDLYLQGLFYYVIYFSLCLPLVFLASSLGLIPAALMLLLGGGGERNTFEGLQYLVLVFTVLFAFVIVRPLAELFKACLSRATIGAYEIDLQNIEHLVEKAQKELRRDGSVPLELLRRVNDELRTVLSDFKAQERVISHGNAVEYSLFLAERAQACADLSACRVFLGTKAHNLILALERLSSGRSLLSLELDRPLRSAVSSETDIFEGQGFQVCIRSKDTKIKRPTGVTVIAVLNILVGFLFVAIVFLAQEQSQSNAPGALVTIMFGIGVSVALLKLQNWARWIVVSVCVFSLVNILGLVVGPQSFANTTAELLLGSYMLWVVWYLFKPHVKAAFGSA